MCISFSLTFGGPYRYLRPSAKKLCGYVLDAIPAGFSWNESWSAGWAGLMQLGAIVVVRLACSQAGSPERVGCDVHDLSVCVLGCVGTCSAIVLAGRWRGTPGLRYVETVSLTPFSRSRISLSLFLSVSLPSHMFCKRHHHPLMHLRCAHCSWAERRH